jgi:hypothetical protein
MAKGNRRGLIAGWSAAIVSLLDRDRPLFTCAGCRRLSENIGFYFNMLIEFFRSRRADQGRP